MFNSNIYTFFRIRSGPHVCSYHLKVIYMAGTDQKKNIKECLLYSLYSLVQRYTLESPAALILVSLQSRQISVSVSSKLQISVCIINSHVVWTTFVDCVFYICDFFFFFLILVESLVRRGVINSLLYLTRLNYSPLFIHCFLF